MSEGSAPRAVFLSLGDNEQAEILHGLYQRSLAVYGLELEYLVVTPGHELSGLYKNLEDPNVLFFLGLNGFPRVGEHSETRRVSVWQEFRKPYFRLFADPPFTSEIRPNIGQEPDPYCFDIVSDYMSFAWLTRLRGHARNLYFIPLHGSYIEVNSAMKPINDREINVLFAASLTPPEAYLQRLRDKLGTRRSENYQQVIDCLAEDFTMDLRSDPFQWSYQAFANNGFSFDANDHEHQMILSELWHFVRMRRRKIIIKTLKDFPITLISDQMIDGIELNPHSRVYGRASTSELLYLMSQCKICVCPPNGYFAFHERVPNAMFQKSVALAAPSVVFEEGLVHGAEAVFYDDLEDGLAQSVAQLLNTPDLLEKISGNAREAAVSSFGVEATANRIFKIYMSVARQLASS